MYLDCLTYHHTHARLTALCPGLPRWAGTRKVKPIWILLKQETVSGSGISWAICKFAPHSRQITMPAPHQSVFYRPDALPAAQPTASKHWRQSTGSHAGITITMCCCSLSNSRTWSAGRWSCDPSETSNCWWRKPDWCWDSSPIHSPTTWPQTQLSYNSNFTSDGRTNKIWWPDVRYTKAFFFTCHNGWFLSLPSWNIGSMTDYFMFN